MKRSRLTKLRVRKISGVDLGGALDPNVTLMKRRDPVAKEQSMMSFDEAIADLPPEKKAAILAAMEKAAGKKDAPAPDEMAKRLLAQVPEEVRKLLDAEKAESAKREEVAKRDAEEAKKAAADIAKRLADIEEANETREFVAKAKNIRFPLETGDLANVLRCVAKGRVMSPDLSKKFETALESVSKALSEGALAEIGSLGGESDNPNTKLQSIAKALKAQNPALSEIAALNEAYRLNPKLYEQARNARA